MTEKIDLNQAAPIEDVLDTKAAATGRVNPVTLTGRSMSTSLVPWSVRTWSKQ